LGNEFVSNLYQLPLHLHQGELTTYQQTDRWAAMFGLPKFEIPQNLVFIDEGTKLHLGNTTFEVFLTPGHSIASLSFFDPTSLTLLSGDVLFKESIGRTDLPGGNFETLAKSISSVLYRLPNETKVYSGHGPTTSIGHEKANNPYVSIKTNP
jgi:glyoxylase-like metal-dependent hydrolase (beta-lactamase superfamily II)